jgi:NADH:ubiquinone reductase (H+-translocating)
MATRILILGGGFAGVYTAVHLQRLWRRDAAREPGVEVTLISRHNYFVMTPLLFEAGSGVLDPRHAVTPIRKLFRSRGGAVRFVQADVLGVDLDARVVHARLERQEPVKLPYDHVVFALGGVTNTSLIPGSVHALTFKTMGDAIFVRNHTIQQFEAADVERDPATKRRRLTFVHIGAGFVGMELVAELSSFVDNVSRYYPNVNAQDIRFELIEALGRIAPEFDEELAEYATEVLRKRGVNIRVNTKVERIEPGRVFLPGGETIDADTIMLAAGVAPSPIVRELPLERDRKGRIVVDATLRSVSRREVWALGDSAQIPDPSGKPYPPLAQHALREARRLAENLTAVVKGHEPRPFIYHTKGLLAALGHYKGVGRIGKVRIKGFIAWWVWRSYYLFQMPQWERRIRIMLDWTVALFFPADVVQLDLFREQQEIRQTAQMKSVSSDRGGGDGASHETASTREQTQPAQLRQFQNS